MNPNKRPLSVTILGCLYLAVGIIGFVYHFTELLPRGAFHYDAIVVELTEFVAILCGAFMLRRQDWARWLALAWMSFHVILSAFDSFRGVVIHSLFLAVIASLLFRPDAARYFRPASVAPL